MRKETTPIGLDSDPTIENLKPVLSKTEGSKIQNRAGWSRREFLSTVALAGAESLLGLPLQALAAEPPLETDKIRVIEPPEICAGTPLIIAQELLQSEGLTQLQVVKMATGIDGVNAVARGEADFSITPVPSLVTRVDAGEQLTLLAGIHIGCFELFGTERVRSLRDLKGKRVAVSALGSGRHIFLASMLAHVGLDPRRDVNWVTRPVAESMQMFARSEIDAFMGFPPEPQELRAKKIGHVVVNTTTDKPWSQYFCCMVLANRNFVRKYPVATKRALRGLLKAANICALEPDRAVKLRAVKGYTAGSEYALQTIKELPYNLWREYDPEDTVRFFALRLHEAGLIKSSPQKIIAQGTDWRFLREIKKELKA
jgi:NitT/TauT family transport system substrate-binding protein